MPAPIGRKAALAAALAPALTLAAAAVFFATPHQLLRELCSAVLFAPVLVASYRFGKTWALVATLAAVLVPATALVLAPGSLGEPHAHRLLAFIAAYPFASLAATWAAERQKASRRRFRRLFDGLPVGLYRAAPEGRILEANLVFARMLGFPDVPSLQGRCMADLYEDPGEKDVVLTAFGSSDLLEHETRFRHAAGGSIWVRLRCRAERRQDGSIAFFEGSVEDVTFRKQAEEEIDAGRRRLEDIIDFLPDATFVIDKKRQVIAWNKAMERLTGVPKDRMLGQGGQAWSLPLFGDRRAGLIDALWEQEHLPVEGHDHVERRGRAILAETFLPAVHGGRGAAVFVAAAPLLDAAGRIAGGIESIRDITERKEAERALAASESKYRSIFENASEGMFRATPDGLIVSANPALAELLGCASPADIVDGQMDLRRFAADPLGPDADIIAGLDGPGSRRRVEVLLRREDGSTLWADVSLRVSVSRGGALQVEGTVLDVTARRQARELLQNAHAEMERRVAERTREIQEANLRLRELDELKSAFLSLASHELRTPLTSVLGFAKLIRKSFIRSFQPLASGDLKLTSAAGRILDNLEIINHEGERLTRLVNDLLDLSKIESGRVEWRDMPLDMSRLLRQSADAVRGHFEANPRINLLVDVPEDLPRINADRDRIHQVLTNLLANAAKFTSEGFVMLKAQPAPETGLEVRVQDTGPGIRDAEREKIFKKFYQIPRNPDEPPLPKGTGLGLTICREVIEHYGGRIWVESEVGKGSTFVFRLPAHQG